MALGGSEEWKSVDQLLSDLFEDPGISSLINASTESSTNNWRYFFAPSILYPTALLPKISTRNIA